MVKPGTPAALTADPVAPSDGPDMPISEPRGTATFVSRPETTAARTAQRRLESHVRCPEDEARRTLGRTRAQTYTLAGESFTPDNGVEGAKLAVRPSEDLEKGARECIEKDLVRGA